LIRLTRADGTTRGHTLAGWGISLLIFVIGVLYICTWWGSGAKFARPWLPQPLTDLAGFVRTHNSHWYYSHFGGWLLFQFAIGVVPVLSVMAFRRTPGDLGLGRFNVLGLRLILASVLISIPCGFLLIHTGAVPLPASFQVALRLLGQLLPVVPEHMCVCGVFVALMLPDRRLPQTIPIAGVQGPWSRRILRWLGLAQPVDGKGGRVLPWFGLTTESLVAVVASGILFWLAHLGKRDIVEVSLSLPGGVAVAYVTLRSRSIWPAIIAHFTMNVIPVGMLAIFR
jgi:hypothetical protein